MTLDVTLKDRNSESRYHWIAGLFGFYKHLDMRSPVTFKDVGIATLIERHRNDANPFYPVKWDSRTFPLNSEFKIPNFGFALYHQSKYDLDRWHFTAGIRLDYERTAMRYHSFCDTGYTVYHIEEGTQQLYRHVDVNIDDTGNLHRQYFNVMPKVGIVYDLPLHDSNIYFSFTRGFKAGGFNTQMFSDVLQQRIMRIMGVGAQYDVDDIVGYKPEKSWNYELGAHLDIIERKLRAEMALFFIDCRDQQLTMFPDGTTTGRIMTNAGRTHSVGGEVSLMYRPLTDLTFNASYGYTHARFVKFNNGINNYKGKALPYVPENTLFLQSVYAWNVRKGKLDTIEFDVNMRGTGKIYWNEANTVSQKLYAMLGAGVTATFGRLQVEVWGKNLTNTRYDTFYFMSMGNEFLQRGIPANGGVTLRLNID